MKRTDSFLMFADRYRFDFGQCSTSNGFAQIDTKQDASWFGIWANPFTLIEVTYCEGDLIVIECETIEEFIAQIRCTYEWNVERGYWKGIDPGLDEKAINRWKSLGFADLLH